MRSGLRSALLAWEFWVPPILALGAMAAIVWLFSHNQDLLRQQQLDRSAAVSAQQIVEKTAEHVDSRVRALDTEIRALRGEVSDARAIQKESIRKIRELTDKVGGNP